MKPPAVSILIPVYNGEAYLAECLESVLAQDFTDFEVLISDDGSTDGSAGIIERYAQRDARIRWWRNPRNLGIGGNFNAPLKVARAEYIKYMLHDDKFIVPTALRQLVEALERDSTVALVVSAAQLIDSESRVVRVRNSFGRSGVFEGKPVIVHCLEENANLIGEPSLALFRRSQAARGFDESLKQLLDLELWFQLLEQGQLAYIAEPLCAFRQHPDQQSEVNRRSGVSAEEDLILMERYWAKPWVRAVATSQALFTQAYYLRRRSSPRAAALREYLAGELGPRLYAFCWVRHKVTKPFIDLWEWFEKRKRRATHSA